jgi:glycosyltransferase involved in cell wall biosynthesis
MGVADDPDLSVVIPVFNVEPYLERCLSSVCEQACAGTYDVIAVDDGSTDRSARILEDCTRRYPRLRVITHAMNRKLSSARTTGVEHARGRYVMHVDSDDYLKAGAIEAVRAACEATRADVLVFNYFYAKQGRSTRLVQAIGREEVTNDRTAVKSHFLGAVWNKVVLRTLMRDSVYGRVGINNTEDLLFGTEVLLRASSIGLVPQAHYVYAVNAQSLTSAVQLEALLSAQRPVITALAEILRRYPGDRQIARHTLDYWMAAQVLEVAKCHLRLGCIPDRVAEVCRELASADVLHEHGVSGLNEAVASRWKALASVRRAYGARFLANLMLGRI